jgi:glycosyltransferase involved in cell wall biosynthesis
MKILLSSHVFAPSIGGLETVSFLLAREFVRRGHEVKVVTQTPEASPADVGLPVIRCPRPWQWLQLTRWSEVFFHNNISLRAAWPLLFCRRPWVVAHHIWIARMDGRLAWPDRLKRFLLRFAINIAISQSLADSLPVKCTVIGDPYQDDLFVHRPEVARDRDLVFLGRLVSDKGVDVLLEALVHLRQRGLTPGLTIIGSGSDEVALRRQTSALDLDGQVVFAGAKQGRALAELLNRHKILVAPSRWREPFGVVALEGLACGCVVVGSEGGGLKAAIGPGGCTFPNGDVNALADRLEGLLRQPERLIGYRQNVEAHLARHRPAAVTQAYLAVFREACGREVPDLGTCHR